MSEWSPAGVVPDETGTYELRGECDGVRRLADDGDWWSMDGEFQCAADEADDVYENTEFRRIDTPQPSRQWLDKPNKSGWYWLWNKIKNESVLVRVCVGSSGDTHLHLSDTVWPIESAFEIGCKFMPVEDEPPGPIADSAPKEDLLNKVGSFWSGGDLWHLKPNGFAQKYTASGGSVATHVDNLPIDRWGYGPYEVKR